VLDRIGAIRGESARIADLLDGADLDARVPSCPDWALRDLVLHLGEVQRSWAGCLRSRRADEPWEGAVAAPRSDGEMAPWMRASTDDLLSALAEVGDESPCWTWWGEPLTSGAVGRHQVQEAAVHRWDTASAVGAPEPLDPEVAHDGVPEFLQVVLSALAADRTGAPPAGLRGPLTFVTTDTGGRWTVVDGAVADPGIERPAGPDGGSAIHGTASDLVLLLYGRAPLSAVTVEGETALVEAFLATFDTE
jgi:uncharacterized protein (TIGR03083 family)